MAFDTVIAGFPVTAVQRSPSEYYYQNELNVK